MVKRIHTDFVFPFQLQSFLTTDVKVTLYDHALAPIGPKIHSSALLKLEYSQYVTCIKSPPVCVCVFKTSNGLISCVDTQLFS